MKVNNLGWGQDVPATVALGSAGGFVGRYRDEGEALSMKYLEFLVDLGIDLVAVFVLAVGLYYRRHRRADLLMALISVNIGLFLTMTLLTAVRVDLSIGFGLFAILSIIQLRSKPATQEEVAYYFAVMVMGLANGLQLRDRLFTILLNIVLIAVLYFIDNRALFSRAYRITVTVDAVIEDSNALVADLERRLHGHVMEHIVEDVDYVREIMVVDVRYKPDNPLIGPRTEARDRR